MLITDLFHQLEYMTREGFYAITSYVGQWPDTKVYTPTDEYCGGTNASGIASRHAAIRGIIRSRMEYEGVERKAVTLDRLENTLVNPQPD